MDTWTIDTARLVAIAQWYTLEPVNVVVATIADGYLAYTVEGYFKTIVLDPSLFEDNRNQLETHFLEEVGHIVTRDGFYANHWQAIAWAKAHRAELRQRLGGQRLWAAVTGQQTPSEDDPAGGGP